MARKRRPVSERFFKYVSPEPNSGCWLWLGGVAGKGYGRLLEYDENRNRHRRPATQVSLEIHGHSRPFQDAMALHHCDNSYCVNPDHLYWGTAQDNVDDMIQRGRAKLDTTRKTHCKRGHALVEENLLVYATRRQCRLCNDHRNHARLASEREARA